MTSSDPLPTVSEFIASPNDDCLLYLLGELDAEQAQRFENRLAGDPSLCDRLLEESEMISALATPAVVHLATEKAGVAATRRTSNLQRWRWVAALVSVAACLALVFQFARFAAESGSLSSQQNRGVADSTERPDENVLIAKAWASSQGVGAAEQEEFTDLQSDDYPEVVLDDQPSDIDSKVSWMFVAIASSSEMQIEGDNGG